MVGARRGLAGDGVTLILYDDEGPALAVAGLIRLEPADPLAPPPPPSGGRWNLPVAVLLALLFNVMILTALFLRLPDRTEARPPEPKTISVELVKPQEKPQQKPRAKAKPQPQPEQKKPEEKKPEPEKKKQEKQPYSESGGDPNLKQGNVPQQQKNRTKEPPRPEARETKKEPPKAAIPDWAKLQPGGDVPAPSKAKGASEATGEPVKLISRIAMGEGGGDAYLNAMRDLIQRNLVYPSSAGGRSGVAVWGMVVSHAGKIQKLTLLRSSGSTDLDYAASLAIQRSVPFDPLPDNYANVVEIIAPIQIAPGR